MESTVFIAVHMVLNFRSVAKTVVIAHQGFDYGWPVISLAPSFLFSLLPLNCPKQNEGGQEAGRWHSWDSWPNQPKRYPMSCNIMFNNKNWGEKKKVKTSWLPRCLLFGVCLGIGLLVGGGAWPPLHHLLFSSFLHLLSCLYQNPQVFTLVFLLFSELLVEIKQGVSEWLLGWSAAGQDQLTFILSHHIEKPKTELKFNYLEKKKKELKHKAVLSINETWVTVNNIDSCHSNVSGLIEGVALNIPILWKSKFRWWYEKKLHKILVSPEIRHREIPLLSLSTTGSRGWDGDILNS